VPQADQVVASTFAIHVTYTCPLTCAHCCFSSGPRVKDRLDVEATIGIIEALDTDTIRMVAFTGGEPFLLGTNLVRLVACASRRGFTTRVVTSAYWASSETETDRLLGRLAAAGLNELSISWDDYHEQQTSVRVTFDHVRRAFACSKSLGLTAAINIVQDHDSSWTAERVKKDLGLPPESREHIVESPLNRTGRAVSELSDRRRRQVRFLGPCPYVLTGPTLSATGKLLACCGVIPNMERLTLDKQPRPETLMKRISDGDNSALLNALYLRGPYAILEWISQAAGKPIPSKEEVGGNCEACRILLDTPSYTEQLDSVLEAKRDEISGERAVLGTMGILNSKSGLMQLWHEGADTLDLPLPSPQGPGGPAGASPRTEP